MAITTYAELQAAAANWLVRSDLTARIPEFITLAEARLNRVMRARLTETEVALSAAFASRTISLPAGFAEPLRLWIERPQGRDELPFVETSLVAVSKGRGEPRCWSVDGANVAFDRPCDQAYGFALRMLRKFALSDAAPTNALLTDFPDLYLFATLSEAAPFLRDSELAGVFEQKLGRALDEANAKEARSRRPGLLVTDLIEMTVGSRR